MNKYCLLILLLLIPTCNFSQETLVNAYPPEGMKKIVLMQPTGETLNELPEMELINDTSELYLKVMNNIENSFVNDFLDLYFIAQTYMKNYGLLDTIEPAYLALTQNQGGFPRWGFAIKASEEIILKSSEPYIDITVRQASQSPDRLMSFTQLYPHEMGHIIFHMLSPEDTLGNNTKNVNMHFFSIVTDYSTAFNEGFAEHIENVSRALEKNEKITNGINADLNKIGKSSEKYIDGFERDFHFPFRLGYYKSSMLNWYQQFEDYVRYEYAVSGDIRYKSRTIEGVSVRDQLTFRNTGVRINRQSKRNIVQLHSTEGVISAFFTHLSMSSLSNQYQEPSFYKPFLYDTTMQVQSPENIFTPIQNQFIKYYHVLHNYVVFNNSDKSQLLDFIKGYIQSFPAEENSIKEIYKKVMATEYIEDLPPPIWLLVKNFNHRLLAFDPFDAITVPLYTFDLNAAEVEDLMTIKGLKKEAAQLIIDSREKNGFFTDLNQINLIEGLSETESNTIMESKFDQEYFDNALEGYDSNLSINSLIISPLKHIFLRASIYFLVFFGLYYLISLKNKRVSTKKSLWLFTRYFFLWVLFVLSGLIAVFIGHGNPYLPMFALFVVVLFSSLLIYRKKKLQRLRTVTISVVMIVLIFLSII